uniref:RHS repeat domain-containing protein n=1 Tax=Snodgrassella alvi TaxID=1196083 RepID=UPI0035A34BF4
MGSGTTATTNRDAKLKKPTPLGRTSQTQWLPHWALPTISVDPDGSIWRYYYDQRGNLRSVIDPHKQRTHYQYDPHGQIVEITDARGGKK